ncbi:hypothetical protein ACQJBY_062936 [Aegilops geniculata]
MTRLPQPRRAPLPPATAAARRRRRRPCPPLAPPLCSSCAGSVAEALVAHNGSLWATTPEVAAAGRAADYMLDKLQIEESLVPKMCLDFYRKYGTRIAGLKTKIPRKGAVIKGKINNDSVECYLPCASCHITSIVIS